MDSAYVNARVAAGTDSASVINLINSTVDEAYITRHSLDSSLALQLLLDSSEIIDLIDSAYVQARQVDLVRDSGFISGIIDSAYVQARVLPATTYNATSSNVTLVKGNAYIVDTSSARTLTLPGSAVLGDEIKVIDGTGQANTNNITINRNGHKIQGLTDNLVINVNRAAQGLVYYNAAQGWILSEN